MYGETVEVLDLAFEDGNLVASVERGEKEGNLLLSWNAIQAPLHFQAPGGGVAFIRAVKEKEEVKITKPTKQIPTSYPRQQYGWRDNAHNGRMFVIVIIPVGHVVGNIADCEPTPVSFKVFQDRMAFYWELEANQDQVKWKIKKTGHTNLNKLCERLNYLAKVERIIVEKKESSPANVVDDNYDPFKGVKLSDMSLGVMWGMLKAGVRAVPAVRYAVGIVGMVAAVGIIKLILDLRIAFISLILLFFCMVFLRVFEVLTSEDKKIFLTPARVLIWFPILYIFGVALLIATSVFFRWPSDLKHWLGTPPPSPTTESSPSQPEHIDISGVSFVEGEEDARAPRLDLQFTNQGVRSAFVTKFNVNVKEVWRLAELPRAGAETAIPPEAAYVVKLTPSAAPYTRTKTISHGLKRDEFGRFTVQFREEWPADSRTIYLADAEIVANSNEKKYPTGDLLFLITQQGERFPNAEKIKETVRVMKERRLSLDLKDFRRRLEENRKMILEADKNKGKKNPALETLIKTAKGSDFEKAFDEE